MPSVPVTPAAISASQLALVGAQVQVAVLRKALDVQAEVGSQLVQAMAQQTGVGQGVDLRA